MSMYLCVAWATVACRAGILLGLVQLLLLLNNLQADVAPCQSLMLLCSEETQVA